MPDDQSIERSELLALTAEIVAAHVGNNAIAGPEVGALIQSVYDTLNPLATDEPSASVELTPACRSGARCRTTTSSASETARSWRC
jgi:predicted transcriptional regulator